MSKPTNLEDEKFEEEKNKMMDAVRLHMDLTEHTDYEAEFELVSCVTCGEVVFTAEIGHPLN